MPFDLLTRKEAAAQVRMSVRTLDTCIKAGKLPVTRLGHRVLVRTDALQTWIGQNTAAAQPAQAVGA